MTKHFAENSKVISIDIDYNELNDGLFNPYIKLNLDLKNFFSDLELNKVKSLKIKNGQILLRMKKNLILKIF